jgi:gamma-glutamyltranspeptidase/glutathione hydrolase
MRTPILLAIVSIACRKPAPAPPPAPAPAAAVTDAQPEAATGCRTGLEPVAAPRGVVAAAHPEAARIGADILRKGGSAADAAVAMAVALTLVEPQSSGIGGGAFLLHHDAATGRTVAWDGRETAPRAATPELFHDQEGPRDWMDVVPGGLSVGTPGLVRLLGDLHAAHGTLPWADLLRPTAELATAGFTVTPRMARSIAQMEEWPMDTLRKSPTAKPYFYPDGERLAAGDTLRNPALAETVERIADGGPDAFYTGALAEQIVAAVEASDRNPGLLTTADLASYRAVQREPVCMDYRGHRVCGHPPPTSGGVTVLEILGLLEPHDVAANPPGSAADVHLFAEATALAWADRDRYLADPDFVGVPVDALLSDAYLAARAEQIQPDGRLTDVAPGVVAFDGPQPAATCPEGRDTTHLVVADAAGNVVSMTSSIENAWGSGIFVGGFLLNNQLTDFSRAVTDDAGNPIANRVQACKRPRSSMAPILVFDGSGEVELALGSPGGSRIISYVARTLVGVLDHDLDIQAAIARPNVVRTRVLELEDDCGAPGFDPADVEALQALGHEVKRTSLNSGLQGIQRVGSGWIGGVDPRREGAVVPVDQVPAP